MFAAPSILKFLPINARSLIFFSLSALRFNPLSSTASGSAVRVLPRTIIYASPFISLTTETKRFQLAPQNDRGQGSTIYQPLRVPNSQLQPNHFKAGPVHESQIIARQLQDGYISLSKMKSNSGTDLVQNDFV